MNRRQFLRTIGAMGVGATVAPLELLEETLLEAHPLTPAVELDYPGLYAELLRTTIQEFQSSLIDCIDPHRDCHFQNAIMAMGRLEGDTLCFDGPPYPEETGEPGLEEKT